MKRILVIGNCGAGKSTLSQKLASRLQLPLISLDKLWWLPGWKEDTRENFDRKLAEVLKQEAWVIDGNYNRTIPERLKCADMVIFLDYSTLRCLWQVIKRVLCWYGKTRPDMGDGCPERFDWEFLCYVWRFRRDKTPQIEAALKGYSRTLFRLKNPKETTEFLENCVQNHLRK